MHRPGTVSTTGYGTCLFCISLRLFGAHSLAASIIHVEGQGTESDMAAVQPLWEDIQSSLVGGSTKGQGPRRHK